MIKSIAPSDYTVRPFRVHKTWTLTTGSDGVVVDEGLYTPGVFDPYTEPTNSISGNYKRLVYDQIRHMYYATDRSMLEMFGGGLDASKTVRVIHDRVNVLSIPVRYFGTTIRPGSVTVLIGKEETGTGGVSDPELTKLALPPQPGANGAYVSWGESSGEPYLSVAHSSPDSFAFYRRDGDTLVTQSSIPELPDLGTAVSWDEDGEYLAVGHEISSSICLSLYKRSGGSLERLVDVDVQPVYPINGMSWAGEYLAIAHNQSHPTGGLSIYKRDGDTVSFLTNDFPITTQANDVAWDNTGTRLAVGHLTWIDLGGGEDEEYFSWFERSGDVFTHMTTSWSPGRAQSGVSWDSTGEYVATGGRNQDGTGLHFWKLEDDTLTRITGSELNQWCSDVDWHPSLPYLVVTTDYEGTFLYERDDDSLVQVTQSDFTSDGEGRKVEWSPDGTHIAESYIWASTEHLALYKFDSGEGVSVSSFLTLRDDGYGNLYNEATISDHIGNVFYEHGILTCTHTGSEYSSSFLDNFTIEFQSTTTIYEHEVLCTVNENEFNVSTNPTAVSNSVYILDHFHEYEYSSSIDPTGSYLAPYITTIGLYDDDLNMVAVAKLAKPIKSLSDYPINFLVRWDT